MEGTTQLDGKLYVVPSLEVIREDGSLPLTLENQSTLFGEVQEGLIVAKITVTSPRAKRSREGRSQPVFGRG